MSEALPDPTVPKAWGIVKEDTGERMGAMELPVMFKDNIYIRKYNSPDVFDNSRIPSMMYFAPFLMILNTGESLVSDYLISLTPFVMNTFLLGNVGTCALIAAGQHQIKCFVVQSIIKLIFDLLHGYSWFS